MQGLFIKFWVLKSAHGAGSFMHTYSPSFWHETDAYLGAQVHEHLASS